MITSFWMRQRQVFVVNILDLFLPVPQQEVNVISESPVIVGHSCKTMTKIRAKPTLYRYKLTRNTVNCWYFGN